MSLIQAAPLLTLLLAWWVAGRAAEAGAAGAGLSRSAVAGLTATLLATAVVAGRLVAVAPRWSSIVAHPLDLLRIGDTSQLSFFGAAAGVGGGLAFFAPRAGLPVPRVADLYGAVAPLGFAVFGGACVLRGDCYGRLAPPPLGIVFPGMERPRLPVELYGAALALFALGFVGWLGRRTAIPGMVALASIATLAIVQAVLEPFRLDADGGAFDREQLVALTVAGLALAAIQLRWLLHVRRMALPGGAQEPAAPGGGGT